MPTAGDTAPAKSTGGVHPDEAALLRGVLDDPGNDAPRLILADWWDEHGQPERAEFCRVQVELASGRPCPNCGDKGYMAYDGFSAACRWCPGRQALRRRERELWRRHGSALAGIDFDPYFVNGWHITIPGVEPAQTTQYMTVTRGFVGSVVLTLGTWVGERCGDCNGTGFMDGSSYVGCQTCYGKRTTPALGPALVAACPLESVRLTDREPANVPQPYWFDSGWYQDYHPGLMASHDLPPELFALLDGGQLLHPGYRCYDGIVAAHAALSRACLTWACHSTPFPHS